MFVYSLSSRAHPTTPYPVKRSPLPPTKPVREEGDRPPSRHTPPSTLREVPGCVTESGEDQPDEFTLETLNDAVELIEGCQDADFAIFKDCDRQAVHEALNQRWLERQNKIAESQAQTKKNPVQIKNNFLYNNQSSGQENKPDEFTLESLRDAVELLHYCEDAETVESKRVDLAIDNHTCTHLFIYRQTYALNLLPSIDALLVSKTLTTL